jgi:hypothetical protein
MIQMLLNLGATDIIVLMVAAAITHLRIKNPFHKMLPSMSLMILSFIIFLDAHQS